MTKNDKHREQVAFLADRLAIAMTYLNDDLLRGVVALPSREDDRDIVRREPEYERQLNIVRAITRRG